MTTTITGNSVISNGTDVDLGHSSTGSLFLNSANSRKLGISAIGNFTRVIPGSPTLYPDFCARAFVSWNGTNGVIRASGNVTSVTRTVPGNYIVAFQTAMPDPNYSFAGLGSRNPLAAEDSILTPTSVTASQLSVANVNGSGGDLDGEILSIIVVR